MSKAGDFKTRLYAIVAIAIALFALHERQHSTSAYIGSLTPANSATTVSVKSFGAVGDGVADDTAAVQAAANSAFGPSGSGVLYLPTGRYKVDTITLPGLSDDQFSANRGYGKRIYGDGSDKSFLVSKLGNNVLNSAYNRFLDIGYLGILGAGQTGNTGKGIYLNQDATTTPNNIHLHDLLVDACGGGGIWWQGNGGANTLWSSSFRNIYLERMGNHGLYISSASPTVLIDGLVSSQGPSTSSTLTSDGRGYHLAIGTFEGQICGLNAGDNNVGTTTGGIVYIGGGNYTIADSHIEAWKGIGMYLRGSPHATLRNMNFYTAPFASDTPICLKVEGNNASILLDAPYFSDGGASVFAHSQRLHTETAASKFACINDAQGLANSYWADDAAAAQNFGALTSYHDNVTSNDQYLSLGRVLLNTVLRGNGVWERSATDGYYRHYYANGAQTYLAGGNFASPNSVAIQLASGSGADDLGALYCSGALRLPGAVMPGAVTLTDASTVNIDASKGNFFYLLTTSGVGASRTFAAPTNGIGLQNGQRILIGIKQDTSGSRTVTWNAAFRFPGAAAPTLTTTASKTDYIEFIYNAADSKWDQVEVIKNF